MIMIDSAYISTNNDLISTNKGDHIKQYAN